VLLCIAMSVLGARVIPSPSTVSGRRV